MILVHWNKSSAAGIAGHRSQFVSIGGQFGPIEETSLRNGGGGVCRIGHDFFKALLCVMLLSIFFVAETIYDWDCRFIHGVDFVDTATT